MRKFTFKSLLIAAALCLGTSAWAGTKILYTQNFENVTEISGWTSPNLAPTLYIGDTTYGNYWNYSIGTNNSRSTYTNWGTELYGEHNKYTIEFDAKISLNTGNTRNQSTEIAVMSDGFTTPSNNYPFTQNNSNCNYLFLIKNTPNTATMAINEGTSTYTQPTSDWCHFMIEVDGEKSTANYTIVNNSTSETISEGTYTIPEGTSYKGVGLYILGGRYNTTICLDNILISTEVDEEVASTPVIYLKSVNGKERHYTIEFTEGETLYYKIPNAENYEEIETGTSHDLIITESGTLKAYSKKGESTSIEVSVEVDASEITLNSPVIKLNTLVANNNMYYPQISVSCDNSNILLSPTATLTYYVDEDVIDIEGSTYTFTKPASLTVVASAAGYTSSEATFEVTSGYVLTKTIDFQSLTADDFDPATWVSATGVPRDYWTDRAAKIPADVTYYKLTDTSAGFANVLDGITIVATNRAPEVYIGYGLLTPYNALSGNNNYMNFIVNGATAEQYVIYEGWNNYGNGTFSTIQAGDAQFGLYRYDTMLKNIKIYSPAISTTISEAGIATFSSAYAVDFSAAEDLKAYTATVSENKVVLTAIENGIVPANTGVILKGAAGDYTGAVTTTETVIENNALVAATEEIASLATQTTVDEVTYKNYILNVVNETPGFYLAAGNKVAAGKAYLQVPVEQANAAKTLTIVWNDGETTGIKDNYEFGIMNSDAATFDLSGRKVANPAKGLYIKNGKKFIVK